ncbi:zinc ion binding [Raphanus sativus]|nr:zinc ion binding [Raphanus sativus]
MKARDMDAVEIVDVDNEDEEEKECEDWCFVCKDGGSLMLCDYKDCPKVYHASCVEKSISVQNNEESLICMWHSCYLCNKRPKLFCLCCPHAVCEGCVTHAEFINLKKNKGLCCHCQEYVITLEEIQEYDAAGDKIDLTDRDTYECLFLEYWEIIKNQESVTFDDVIASKSRKKAAAKAKSRYKDDPKFELHHVKSSKSPKKGIIKLEDDDDDDPQFSLTDYAEDNKTTPKTKRMEFIGWGSKPLIEFLTSIGEDTREEISQHTVESVIKTYIREKNLLDNEIKNKKKVRCDEKLFSIFRKKYVNQKRIYSLLNAHFKENVEQIEYISLLERGFGEKNHENVSVPCKKQKTETSDEETCEMEVKPEMRPTGLAAISADNIKLVYLRKSLVMELLKQSGSFRNKVVGSFVKVRNDPRDPIAFQVLQVTDLKSVDDKGMFLYVAGEASDVSISRLDDSDITKEEIDDLKQKVMSGLRQPTLVEMKQKAKVLHEDITKHEYLEERELLQKPSEQERLLRQTPKIIEELVEIEQDPPAASSDSSKQGNITGLSQEVVVIDID